MFLRQRMRVAVSSLLLVFFCVSSVVPAYAQPDRSAYPGLSASAASSPSTDKSSKVVEVGGAPGMSANVVCLVSSFSGYINPLATVQSGPYSTTQCKYIDIQLNSGSTKVWVRVRYYKGNTAKYTKWVYLTTTALYRLTKNPKAGSVFYLEFRNPFAAVSYEAGAVYY